MHYMRDRRHGNTDADFSGGAYIRIKFCADPDCGELRHPESSPPLCEKHWNAKLDKRVRVAQYKKKKDELKLAGIDKCPKFW